MFFNFNCWCTLAFSSSTCIGRNTISKWNRPSCLACDVQCKIRRTRFVNIASSCATSMSDSNSHLCTRIDFKYDQSKTKIGDRPSLSISRFLHWKNGWHCLFVTVRLEELRPKQVVRLYFDDICTLSSWTKQVCQSQRFEHKRWMWSAEGMKKSGKEATVARQQSFTLSWSCLVRSKPQNQTIFGLSIVNCSPTIDLFTIASNDAPRRLCLIRSGCSYFNPINYHHHSASACHSLVRSCFILSFYSFDFIVTVKLMCFRGGKRFSFCNSNQSWFARQFQTRTQVCALSPICSWHFKT